MSSSQFAQIPEVILNDQTLIPQLGFGTYKVPSEDAYHVVSEALEVGYRLIDTAAFYGNEEGVGRAIRDSGIPRNEIYVTTKLWNTEQGKDRTTAAFHASLERLGLDYIDLYLIHWPQPKVDKYLETWEEMITLRDTDELRSIGVSNFTKSTLERIISETGVSPVLNQIELHPGFSQSDMREWNSSLGIRTQAWSPLARGAALDAAPIASLAEKYGKSPAQIVLRWHIQMGNLVIPKAMHRSYMQENFTIFDFWLTDEELASITSLDRFDGRMSKDPDEFNSDL